MNYDIPDTYAVRYQPSDIAHKAKRPLEPLPFFAGSRTGGVGHFVLNHIIKWDQPQPLLPSQLSLVLVLPK